MVCRGAVLGAGGTSASCAFSGRRCESCAVLLHYGQPRQAHMDMWAVFAGAACTVPVLCHIVFGHCQLLLLGVWLLVQVGTGLRSFPWGHGSPPQL